MRGAGRDRRPTRRIELRWVTDEADVRGFFAVGAAAYTSLGLPEQVAIEALRAPERFLEPRSTPSVSAAAASRWRRR